MESLEGRPSFLPRGASSDEPDVAGAVRAVRRHMRQGRGEAALRIARRMEAVFPDAARVLLGEIALAERDPRAALAWVEGVPGFFAEHVRGTALLALGLPEEAARAFRRGVEKAPASERGAAWCGLGEALARLRTPEADSEARRALRRALAFADADTGRRAARLLADLARRMGDLAEAVRYLRRALFFAPDDAACRREYGALLAELGRFGEARRLYESTLRRTPEAAWAYAELARLDEREGRLRRADRRWRKAIELDPLHPEHRLARGRLRLAEGGPRGRAAARRFFREVLSLEPNHPEARLHLGDDAFERGDPGEAKQHYEAFLAATARTGHESRARVLLALADLMTRAPADAAARRSAFAFLKRARQELPEETGWLVAEARLHRAGRDLAAARRTLERALAAEPNDPAVRYEAAVLAMEEGRDEDAVSHLEKALRLDCAPLYLAELGQLHLRRGAYRAAARRFRELLSADVTNDWALAGWAVALARSGRPARACAAWDRFLHRVPRSAEGKVGKAEALLYGNRLDEAEALLRPLARRGGEIGTAARVLRAALCYARGDRTAALRRLARVRRHRREVLREFAPVFDFLGWRP